MAAAWLVANHCKILARNYRDRHRGIHTGEVDIVAREGRLLLFIEVKTRHPDARVRGFDAVDQEKRRLIERGANHWLRQLGTRDIPWRFDVIEVALADGEKPRVNRVRDAF